MIVDLGYQHYVRADEIVAVCETSMSPGYTSPLRLTLYGRPQCAVVLRNGVVLAGYVSARTLRKRWRAALDELTVLAPPLSAE